MEAVSKSVFCFRGSRFDLQEAWSEASTPEGSESGNLVGFFTSGL